VSSGLGKREMGGEGRVGYLGGLVPAADVWCRRSWNCKSATSSVLRLISPCNLSLSRIRARTRFMSSSRDKEKSSPVTVGSWRCSSGPDIPHLSLGLAVVKMYSL
jgi:hypothetical protein